MTLLITIILGLYENSIYYVTFLWMAGKKLRIQKELAYCLLYSMITTLIYELPIQNGLWETLIRVVLPLFFTYFIFRQLLGPNSLPMVYAVVWTAVLLISQIAILQIATHVFKLTLYPLPEGVAGQGLLVFIFAGVLVIFYLLRPVYQKAITYLVSYILKLKKISLNAVNAYILLVAALLVSLFFITLSSDNSANMTFTSSIIIFYIASIIISSLVVVWIIKRRENELLLQSQSELIKSYESVLADIKGFWHSYANIMQVIDIMVSTEYLEVSDVKDALREFSSGYHDDHISTKIAIAEVPHMIVACVLSSKLTYAKQLGVNLEIDAFGKETTAIDWQMRDLTEVLGILLDNAIEAAYYADLKVSVTGSLTPQVFKFGIQNSYTTVDGMVKKYGVSNGVGLKRIESLTAKHKHIHYTKSQDNGLYTAQVTISNRL